MKYGDIFSIYEILSEKGTVKYYRVPPSCCRRGQTYSYCKKWVEAPLLNETIFQEKQENYLYQTVNKTRSTLEIKALNIRVGYGRKSDCFFLFQNSLVFMKMRIIRYSRKRKLTKRFCITCTEWEYSSFS